MRKCFLPAIVAWACAPNAGPSAEPAAPASPPFSTVPVPEPVTAPAPSQSALAVAAPRSLEFDVGPLREPNWREQTSTPRVRVKTPRVPLKKRWSARIGKTTFRSTMALVGDAIVIGSHGASLQGKNEKSDGVYVLDGKTGKKRLQIATPGTGDLDVGGIAVEGDVVYFTTDNSQIVAAALGTGKVVWKAAARGKVRPAPALGDLNGDGHVDVVAGDEEGVLRALDGKSGQSLWLVATGVNEYSARGFIGAAAIADLDGDQRDDVIAGARDGILAAYRGRDGSVIWQVPGDSGIHASPSVADFDQDGRPEVLSAWSYGQIAIVDGRSGAKRWQARMEQDDGGIEGLFGSPIPLPGAPGVLVAPTAWWGGDDGVIGVAVEQRAWKGFEGRVSATPVVGDIDGDGSKEAIIGTEKGKLIALSADGERAELATLGGPIEAPALLADADGDGRWELFVASNDGLLTCFETAAATLPDVSRFRGSKPHNRGDLGPIRLGWRAREAASGAPPSVAGPPSVRVDYLRCCTALTEAAARAPAPQDAALLNAAGQCNTLAARAAPRDRALSAIKTALDGKATLPEQCR